MKPIRLQLSRKAGFDLQEISRAANGLEAVNVARGRGRRWGNPFNFRSPDCCWLALSYGCRGDAPGRQEASVRAFREWVTPIPGKLLVSMERGVSLGNGEKSVAIGPRITVGPPPSEAEIREHLRGRNLACWCAPGAPCHADVLLEIANPEEAS